MSASFICPHCGAESFNPNDISELYCGRCHVFVDDASNHRRTDMNELQETVATLIELDEPEALLRTLRDAAARQKGRRWAALTSVLIEAEWKLDQILNAKPAGPDFRPPVNTDAEAKSGVKETVSPSPIGADHAQHTDPAAEAAKPSPTTA
jgi:hypothetical protein